MTDSYDPRDRFDEELHTLPRNVILPDKNRPYVAVGDVRHVYGLDLRPMYVIEFRTVGNGDPVTISIDRDQALLLARTIHDIEEERCPTCGQPDNCGDCDHTPSHHMEDT